MLLIKYKNSQKKLTTAQFIERAKKMHGDTYLYDKSEYTLSQHKLTITCRIHGDFSQQAKLHILGGGCKLCHYEKIRKQKSHITTDNLIERSRVIHGDAYLYDKTVYVDYLTKFTITCRSHGDFYQTANRHLSGNGCPKCAKLRKMSKQECEWLDSLNISTLIRQHSIYANNRCYVVDAYDSATNTIYEYHGDYWHGNLKKYDASVINQVTGKTMGELYEQTILREQELRELNYNLVVMWESDYRKNSFISKR